TLLVTEYDDVSGLRRFADRLDQHAASFARLIFKLLLTFSQVVRRLTINRWPRSPCLATEPPPNRIDRHNRHADPPDHRPQPALAAHGHCRLPEETGERGAGADHGRAAPRALG